MEKEAHSFNTNINIPLSPGEGQSPQLVGCGSGRGGTRGRSWSERTSAVCGGTEAVMLFPSLYVFFFPPPPPHPTPIPSSSRPFPRCRPAVLDVYLAKRAKTPSGDGNAKVRGGDGGVGPGAVPRAAAFPPCTSLSHFYLSSKRDIKPAAAPWPELGVRGGGGREDAGVLRGGTRDSPVHITGVGVQSPSSKSLCPARTARFQSTQFRKSIAYLSFI